MSKPLRNLLTGVVLALSLFSTLPPAEAATLPTAHIQAIQTDYTARFEDSECPFYVSRREAVRCGFLIVPEDRRQPQGPTIQIAVAVYYSTGTAPSPDPLIYLDGGPGAYTLELLGEDARRYFRDFLGERDLILFDQRGIGYSEPSLDCPEIEEAHTLNLLKSSLDGTQVVEEALLACRDRLQAQNISLSAYSSRENAADVVDMARVLGYTEFNLMGGSYGTRLALTVMRDYPDQVRSAILDSTYPPQVDSFLFASAANMERSLELLFAACIDDEACDAAYPNLRNVFYKVIDLHNQTPVTLSVYDFRQDRQQDVLIDGERLIRIVWSLLYSSQSLPYIPEMIYELRYSDYETLEWLASSYFSQYTYVSEGMYYAVECNEDVPFMTLENLLALSAGVNPRVWESLVQTPDFLGFCADWMDVTPDPLENEAVYSTVPTLIFSGEYDPITPPAWGELVAATLPNSYVFEFPGLSHGVVSAHECPTQMARTFLRNPSRAPNSVCLAYVPPLRFNIN